MSNQLEFTLLSNEGDFANVYAKAVTRAAELARLLHQAGMRQSMLVYGPKGSGKTRLLRSFCDKEPLSLFVRKAGSPREFMLELLFAIASKARKGAVPENLCSLSTRSLKGVADRALNANPYLVVIDHLIRPAAMFTQLIKDLNYFGRTPIVFAARSAHMEDIGGMQSLCALKSERLELKNWPAQVACEFAKREAAAAGLSSDNLASAIQSIVDWSNGNPSSILSLIRMAQDPKYRSGENIKVHTLYVDFRMGSFRNEREQSEHLRPRRAQSALTRPRS